MSGRYSLLSFALASAVAVAAGAITLAAGGMPMSVWIRNVLAWSLGASLALIAVRIDRQWQLSTLVLVCLLILFGSLAAEPVQGVHRWLDLGPLHINAAGLALPPMIASLARLENRALSLAVLSASGVIAVLQPDASQACALAAAALVLLIRRSSAQAEQLLILATCLGIGLTAALRPDPLQPVPEVEGIFTLAAGISLVLAAAGAAALALAAMAPLAAARAENSGATALAVYFAVTAAAPLAGAYPVPLVGLGMSFPIGWWLGMAITRKTAGVVAR